MKIHPCQICASKICVRKSGISELCASEIEPHGIASPIETSYDSDGGQHVGTCGICGDSRADVMRVFSDDRSQHLEDGWLVPSRIPSDAF